MTITIRQSEITLKYSMRALFQYENITGQSFNPTTIENFCTFFYCVVCSSNKDLDLTFDEFIDEVIDPQPELMNQFASWLSSTMQKNSFLSGAAQSQEKESKGKGNKKKP
nr:MAG TPA: tail assembly chaperone protein [Caudoviricetes sp.]